MLTGRRLRRLERLSLFGDVLLERVRQIGRCVLPGFDGEFIKEGSVFIPDTTAGEPPNRSIGRVAEQAFQGGNIGRQLLASSMPE